MPACTCYTNEVDGHHYVEWIYNIFSDCVYVQWEWGGGACGGSEAEERLSFCATAFA
jgi:hypothetical protein